MSTTQITLDTVEALRSTLDVDAKLRDVEKAIAKVQGLPETYSRSRETLQLVGNLGDTSRVREVVEGSFHGLRPGMVLFWLTEPISCAPYMHGFLVRHPRPDYFTVRPIFYSPHTHPLLLSTVTDEYNNHDQYPGFANWGYGSGMAAEEGYLRIEASRWKLMLEWFDRWLPRDQSN